MIARVVQFIGGIFQGLLFFRFLYHLFEADPETSVGQVLINGTDPVVKIFDFVPTVQLQNGLVIDFRILATMVAVAIVWYALIEFIDFIVASLSKR